MGNAASLLVSSLKKSFRFCKSAVPFTLVTKLQLKGGVYKISCLKNQNLTVTLFYLENEVLFNNCCF